MNISVFDNDRQYSRVEKVWMHLHISAQTKKNTKTNVLYASKWWCSNWTWRQQIETTLYHFHLFALKVQILSNAMWRVVKVVQFNLFTSLFTIYTTYIQWEGYTHLQQTHINTQTEQNRITVNQRNQQSTCHSVDCSHCRIRLIYSKFLEFVCWVGAFCYLFVFCVGDSLSRQNKLAHITRYYISGIVIYVHRPMHRFIVAHSQRSSINFGAFYIKQKHFTTFQTVLPTNLTLLLIFSLKKLSTINKLVFFMINTVVYTSPNKWIFIN